MKKAFEYFVLTLVSSVAFGQELTYVKGLIYHHDYYKGRAPAVVSQALSPKNWKELKGYNALLPFVTPAPDQEDAHSCMLMSLTGVAEFWLNRYQSNTEFIPNGDWDLSERWWMNLSYSSKHASQAKYWYTDAIYLFNSADAARNRDYPFVKGWHTEVNYKVTPATPSDLEAVYGVRYNWFNEITNVSQPLIDLPRFERKVLFKDPDENPWAIGSAPQNIVTVVMNAIKKYQAPVQVIYNHSGIWHSVVVVGFDQEMSTRGCPFIEETKKRFNEEIKISTEEKDMDRVSMFQQYRRDLERSLKKNGGCYPKGMFYVRDSFYSDSSEPLYVYDVNNPGASRPYSKRVILREFDWLRNFANHISVIYPVANNN